MSQFQILNCDLICNSSAGVFISQTFCLQVNSKKLLKICDRLWCEIADMWSISTHRLPVHCDKIIGTNWFCLLVSYASTCEWDKLPKFHTTSCLLIRWDKIWNLLAHGLMRISNWTGKLWISRIISLEKEGSRSYACLSVSLDRMDNAPFRIVFLEWAVNWRGFFHYITGPVYGFAIN